MEDDVRKAIEQCDLDKVNCFEVAHAILSLLQENKLSDVEITFVLAVVERIRTITFLRDYLKTE